MRTSEPMVQEHQHIRQRLSKWLSGCRSAASVTAWMCTGTAGYDGLILVPLVAHHTGHTGVAAHTRAWNDVCFQCRLDKGQLLTCAETLLAMAGTSQ